MFPFTINLDDNRLWAGFNRLREISDEVEAAKVQGGLFSYVKRGYLAANAALVFARIYMLPVVPNELPADIRMAPAW